jgi:hypothetical protein
MYTYSDDSNYDRVGPYPQAEEMVAWYNQDGKDSLYIMEEEDMYFQSPNLDGFKLKKKAKMNDFMFCVPSYGEIVSEKTKRILEASNLTQYVFWESVLYQGNKSIHGYHMFLWKRIPVEEVIFSKSTFILRDISTEASEQRVFESYEQYARFKNDLKYSKRSNVLSPRLELISTRIALPKKFSELDFLDVEGITLHRFLSDRLASEFISEDITGIVLEERDMIDFV